MVNEIELTDAYGQRKSVNHSFQSPVYGIMQIDGKPATSVHFERTDIRGTSEFHLLFCLAGKTLLNLSNIDESALRIAVGEKNAMAILGHPQSKGILEGVFLQNYFGTSPENLFTLPQEI